MRTNMMRTTGAQSPLLEAEGTLGGSGLASKDHGEEADHSVDDALFCFLSFFFNSFVDIHDNLIK